MDDGPVIARPPTGHIRSLGLHIEASHLTTLLLPALQLSKLVPPVYMLKLLTDSPVIAYSPARQIGASGLHIETPHLLSQEGILRCVLVDVQLYFLVLCEARLPVPFHPIAVVLLAAAVKRVFLFAGPQTVVFTIVSSAGR